MITEFDGRAQAAAVLAFSNALERLLRRFEVDNGMRFAGEMKMLINSIKHSSQSFRHYIERFNEAMITSMYDKSKDIALIDQMQEDGDEMIRLFLLLLNAKSNGFTTKDIEDAINASIDDIEGHERVVSQELIDTYHMSK